MKRMLAIVAAGLALVATNTGSTAPREGRAAAPPAAASESALLPLLLAQDRRMPTCQLDGREVPVGTAVCRQKRVWVCQRNDWVNSEKPC